MFGFLYYLRSCSGYVEEDCEGKATARWSRIEKAALHLLTQKGFLLVIFLKVNRVNSSIVYPIQMF